MAFAAILNLAAAHPYPHAKLACPKPALPVIPPVVLQAVAPAPIDIGPEAPGVIEHASAPYEINYFEPYIVKHKQSAALNVFAKTPVVVDEYAAPVVNEAVAPPAVIVEEVCPAPPPPAALLAAAQLPLALPVPAYPCH